MTEDRKYPGKVYLIETKLGRLYIYPPHQGGESCERSDEGINKYQVSSDLYTLMATLLIQDEKDDENQK